MRTIQTRRITRLDQMALLASPVRQELVDVLARMGTVSLAEVAAALGRPPDGLYYHVRLLVRAGLVRSAGTRRRCGVQEALFRSAAPQFAVRYAPHPAPEARAVESIVAAMLRIGIRDFRRALGHADTRVEGPSRDLWALRTTGWLLPAQLRMVNRLILKLSVAATRTTPRGRLYGVTVLLAPLAHRVGRERRGRRRKTPT